MCAFLHPTASACGTSSNSVALDGFVILSSEGDKQSPSQKVCSLRRSRPTTQPPQPRDNTRRKKRKLSPTNFWAVRATKNCDVGFCVLRRRSTIRHQDTKHGDSYNNLLRSGCDAPLRTDQQQMDGDGRCENPLGFSTGNFQDNARTV